MARAYSLDLRERVVAAVAAGESCRTVAATFKVSVASVVKWSQRFRATGSAAARKRGWQRPYAVASERVWLLARLAEKPDITLRSLQAELVVEQRRQFRRDEVRRLLDEDADSRIGEAAMPAHLSDAHVRVPI